MCLSIFMSTIGFASERPSIKLGAGYPIASKKLLQPDACQRDTVLRAVWQLVMDTRQTRRVDASGVPKWRDTAFGLMLLPDEFWTSVKTLTKASEVGLKISHRKTSTKWQRKAPTVASVWRLMLLETIRLMLLETISLDEVWLAEYVTVGAFLDEILFSLAEVCKPTLYQEKSRLTGYGHQK